jgi:hypothetical protein
MKNFGYQAERLRKAVYALMLPHPSGEADSIIRALHECSMAFQDLDREDLDESAKEWVQKIDGFLGGESLHSTSQEQWLVKAKTLSPEKQFELSRCIYELNAWFHQYFWSERDDE